MSKAYKLPLTNENLLYIIPGIFALSSILIVNPPKIFDDLYRFYEYYKIFQDMPVRNFIKFLRAASDYLIPIYIYVASKLHLPVNILLGFITYFNVFIILKISYLILKNKSIPIIAPIFITTAISLSGLLSGVRNLHSISLAYLALYFLINNSKIKATSVYLVSFLAHFSALLYIIIPALLRIKFKNIYFLWLISLLGFFTPIVFSPYLSKDIVYSSQPLIAKIQHYFFLKDSYYELSYANIKILLAFSVKLSWYLFVLIFLFKQTKNTDDIWMKVLFIFSIMMNFLFTYLTVFERVSFFTKILFVVCLIRSETISMRNKKIIFIYFLILFVFQIALFVEGLFDFIKN